MRCAGVRRERRSAARASRPVIAADIDR